MVESGSIIRIAVVLLFLISIVFALNFEAGVSTRLLDSSDMALEDMTQAKSLDIDFTNAEMDIPTTKAFLRREFENARIYVQKYRDLDLIDDLSEINPAFQRYSMFEWFEVYIVEPGETVNVYTYLDTAGDYTNDTSAMTIVSIDNSAHNSPIIFLSGKKLMPA